jgi:hypothetical protein
MSYRFFHALLLSAVISSAADRVTITGAVTDNVGKPLENATVMVYHAGVKQGYSTICPSCYADCGKRTVTDSSGSFTIKNLAPDLWFELLVVRDGYAPVFVSRVDPSRGAAKTAILARRANVADRDRVVRGRVVNTNGLPMPAAVIQPQILMTPEGSSLPPIAGLEPIAVSNQNGEFELAYSKKASRMLLRVEVRGMAAKLALLPTGEGRTTVTISDGAVIRGRLVKLGKPVAGAEIGLVPRTPCAVGPHFSILGDCYDEVRIGTEADGSFVIPNVPTPVEWNVYGKMESLRALGATSSVECATRREGGEIDLGNIEVKPGHHLRGALRLGDGASVPTGMRITIGRTSGPDSQTVAIGADGRFEFVNLAEGKYNVMPSVRGYSLPRNQYCAGGHKV